MKSITKDIELNKYVLIDVCNTLFDSNTTFDFLDYYFKQNRFILKSISLKLIVSKFSPVHILLKILTLLYSKDYYKIAGVFLLKGQDTAKVEINAHSFVRKVLSKKRIKSVFELLEKNINSTILLSSSIEPVIKMIAKEYGIKKYYSSTLSKSNGNYTGHIISDLTGIKERKVITILNDNCLIVTDNKTDFNLAKLCSQKIIVIGHPNEKKFWKSLNPTFVYR